MKVNATWRMSKHRVISGPYFPAFSLNTGTYGPEITPHLDTFHAVEYKWIQRKTTEIFDDLLNLTEYDIKKKSTIMQDSVPLNI